MFQIGVGFLFQNLPDSAFVLLHTTVRITLWMKGLQERTWPSHREMMPVRPSRDKETSSEDREHGCLPLHRGLGVPLLSVKGKPEPFAALHICNLNFWEAETEGSEVQGFPQLIVLFSAVLYFTSLLLIELFYLSTVLK